MKKSAFTTIALAGIISLTLAACGSGSSSQNTTEPSKNSDQPATSTPVASTPVASTPVSSIKNLTMAAQSYTEAIIDNNLIAQIIEAKTPIKVTIKKTSGASALIHSLLKQGDVDMYISYDGTEFMEQYHKSYDKEFAGHPELVAKYVKEEEMKEGIWVSPPLGYQDTYALAVTAEMAKKYNLKTVSDAIPYVKDWTLATDSTFPYLKPVGLDGFEAAYNMKFKKAKPMDYSLVYPALASGSVQASIVYSTDGRLQKLNQVPLEDDKSFFPPYNGILLIKESIRKEANLDEVLAPLWGAVTTQEQTQMNYDVDVMKKEASDVAHDFLVKKKLISK